MIDQILLYINWILAILWGILLGIVFFGVRDWMNLSPKGLTEQLTGIIDQEEFSKVVNEKVVDSIESSSPYALLEKILQIRDTDCMVIYSAFQTDISRYESELMYRLNYGTLGFIPTQRELVELYFEDPENFQLP